MDDPDMRYGFAIDKLFSKRQRREASRCKCGRPIGVGQLGRARLYCNACRAERVQMKGGDGQAD